MTNVSNITIAFHHERSIDAQAVRRLYDVVGWWPDRKVEAIKHMLAGDLAIGAWDDHQLIGFARAVSDQHFRAYIEDVMVHPAYRRHGIGHRLLAQLLDALSHIETISLFCEPGLVGMYARHSFRARPSQIVMHRSAPA